MELSYLVAQVAGEIQEAANGSDCGTTFLSYPSIAVFHLSVQIVNGIQHSDLVLLVNKV